jgi:hypothetical protein
MKHSILRTLAGLLLAGALLPACAGPDVNDSGSASGTTAPTTVPGNPPVTRPTPPPGGQLTVTGTVREGVEPGCLLLDADQGRFLLVGGERGELRAGSRVQVTGRVARGLMSTCQQGEPLVVAAIEPAP